jgi:predicted DNA-binding protein
VTTPDFDRMTKDEVIAWFNTTDNLGPAVASMTPATEPAPRRPAEVPMMLASIRLPVALVEQLDSLADLQGVRRSDVIREALTAYVGERTSPVDRDEAEHALDVLRRLVANRGDDHAVAA